MFAGHPYRTSPGPVPRIAEGADVRAGDVHADGGVHAPGVQPRRRVGLHGQPVSLPSPPPTRPSAL